MINKLNIASAIMGGIGATAGTTGAIVSVSAPKQEQEETKPAKPDYVKVFRRYHG